MYRVELKDVKQKTNSVNLIMFLMYRVELKAA